MTMPIMGAAGFFGCAMARQAVAQDHDLIVLDALTYSACIENLGPISGSPRYPFKHVYIRVPTMQARISADHQPQTVLHLVVESHADRSIVGPSDFRESNINGTFKLLEARNFVRTPSERQSLEVGSPDAIAFRGGNRRGTHRRAFPRLPRH